MSGLLNVMYTDAEYLLAGMFMVFFIMFMILISCIAITALVLGIIGQWKMFEKAKEKGWKSLIPVYNLYTMCKVTGVNPWWIVVSFVVAVASAVFNSVSPISDPDAWGLTIFVILFGLLNFAVSIYFAIIMAVSTARSYGKEDGWAVGLYFLKPFFMFALGIGKSKYVGATPMKDPILGRNSKTSTKKGKFCGECGKEVDKSAKFCPHCGKKI